eukprot:m.50891 g.50891  ORF g.50891 m.50891 type:complete len:143 (-) comp11194_c0_seq4:813-1241(-)
MQPDVYEWLSIQGRTLTSKSATLSWLAHSIRTQWTRMFPPDEVATMHNSLGEGVGTLVSDGLEATGASSSRQVQSKTGCGLCGAYMPANAIKGNCKHLFCYFCGIQAVMVRLQLRFFSLVKGCWFVGWLVCLFALVVVRRKE